MKKSKWGGRRLSAFCLKWFQLFSFWTHSLVRSFNCNILSKLYITKLVWSGFSLTSANFHIIAAQLRLLLSKGLFMNNIMQRGGGGMVFLWHKNIRPRASYCDRGGREGRLEKVQICGTSFMKRPLRCFFNFKLVKFYSTVKEWFPRPC